MTITWAEYNRRVRDIAAGLAALGVRRGDTVGLMLTHRPEFHLCDTAAMHLGAAPFSLYNTSAPEQITYILGNAGNSVMICDAVFVDRIREAGPGIGTIVCVDGNPLGTLSLKELEALGRPDFDFDRAWQAVAPEDVLTLIYTSGTTGPPKGCRGHARRPPGHAGVDVGGRAVAGRRPDHLLPALGAPG